MAREDELQRQLDEALRRLAVLEDSLRTQNSSPQDDVLGSKQRSFTKQFLKGNGHVSEITLNEDGTGLTVRKVQ